MRFAVLGLVSALQLDGGPGKDGWYVTLDGVMGGRSSGDITTAGGVLDFSGVLNVHGGGFASISRRVPPDVTSYTGVVVDFETQNGGSRPVGWELQVQDTSQYSYAHAFANPIGDGSRTQVYLPFADFGPGKIMGQQCRGCVMNWRQVQEVKLYMLFQDGAYHLRVHSIAAVTAPPASAAPPSLAMDSAAAKELVRQTIQYGAPVYDQGYPALCDAMYESAMRSIMAARGVPEALRGPACAGANWEDPDPRMRAWALRRAMDKITGDDWLRYPSAVLGDWLDQGCDEPAADEPAADEPAAVAPVLESDAPAAGGRAAVESIYTGVSATQLDGGAAKSGWRVVLDGVMGGRSTGDVTASGGVLDFSGYCNLRGGGFASITRQVSADLSGHSGFVIDFETQNGGSRPMGWELQVQDTSPYSFGHAFANPIGDGSRMRVYLPFTGFGSGGWRSCESCDMDWARTREVKLYMLFQEGPYHLRVHSIAAVSAPPELPAVAVTTMNTGDVQALIRATIEGGGAKTYDEGYPGVCEAMYASVLTSIAAARGVPAEMRDAACAGLAWEPSSGGSGGAWGAKMRAWALRRAMDRILGEESWADRYPSAVRGDWLDARCEDVKISGLAAVQYGDEGQLMADGSSSTLVAVLGAVSGVLLVTAVVCWRRAATMEKRMPREVTVMAPTRDAIVTGRMVPEDLKGNMNTAAAGLPVRMAMQDMPA